MVYVFLGAVIHEPLLLDYESALECRVKLGFPLRERNACACNHFCPHFRRYSRGRPIIKNRPSYSRVGVARGQVLFQVRLVS